MSDSPRDAIASLLKPEELRDSLARRVREAAVIRQLLRVSEFAEVELSEFADDNSPCSTTTDEGEVPDA